MWGVMQPSCISVGAYFLSNSLHSNDRKYICDRIWEKGSYSLSNCIHLTVHCETCEYGTNLKFGHLTFLTWFYS